MWGAAEKVFGGTELQTFRQLVYAAIDAKLNSIAVDVLEKYFTQANNNLLKKKDAFNLLAEVQKHLPQKFELAAKQQAAWDALAVAPRTKPRARTDPNGSSSSELSEEAAARSMHDIFRHYKELAHTRAWARYGYSARDIASGVRQGVEDFIYSTLGAAPEHLDCAPFCSETSVNERGEPVNRCGAKGQCPPRADTSAAAAAEKRGGQEGRGRRCATKECSNLAFDMFDDAQQVVRVKEYVCGALAGGSLRDRMCGMPLQEMSTLFSTFLAMYKQNSTDDSLLATLNNLTRHLENDLALLSATATKKPPPQTNAHSLVPSLSRAALIQNTQPRYLLEMFRHICVVFESKRSSISRDGYIPHLKQHLTTL